MFKDILNKSSWKFIKIIIYNEIYRKNVTATPIELSESYYNEML